MPNSQTSAKLQKADMFVCYMFTLFRRAKGLVKACKCYWWVKLNHYYYWFFFFYNKLFTLLLWIGCYPLNLWGSDWILFVLVVATKEWFMWLQLINATLHSVINCVTIFWAACVITSAGVSLRSLAVLRGQCQVHWPQRTLWNRVQNPQAW